MICTIRSLILFFPVIFVTFDSNAQCSVSSTNGYTVNLHVRPVAVIPNSDACVNGYQYKVRMAYDISFTGTNIPGSMYTLQGTVTCGSTSIFFNLPNSGGSGTVLSSNASTSRTDCSTVTPFSLGCNTVNIQIQGPSLSNRTIACSFSLLPIELVSFNAEAMDDHVALNWTTASERDNDHFTVERSMDGSSFIDIKRIAAIGNSTTTQHYVAVDPTPLNGTNYYRLRQTDIDGTQSWSPVVVAHTATSNTFTIFPNPTSSGLLRIAADHSGNELQLYSASGQLVHRAPVNDNTASVPALPSGIYEARMIDPETLAVSHARVVIE